MVEPVLSAEMADAWSEYQAGVEEIRQFYYNHAFAGHVPDRDLAHYHVMQLQAAAFNLVIAPRPDYPRFTLHGMFDPISLTWLGPNPDTPYRGAFVDGARTYRIWGKRGTSSVFLLQSVNSYFALPPTELKENAAYNFDEDFETAPDGSFEIIVSAAPQDGKNWIRIDREQERNFILAREYLIDWSREKMAELHIEAIDDVPARPINHSEAEMRLRLADAVRFMRFAVSFYQPKVTEDALRDAGGEVNRFAIQDISSAPPSAAGNSAVAFNTAVFDIEADEALIIEFEPPNVTYWGMQLSDRWSSLVGDYAYHQSSLNKGQAVVDSDGKVRVVLCCEDPGVHNWLDPVGNLKGMITVRWLPYCVALPEAKKVKISDLAQALPADTKWVKPDERAAILSDRARAALRRYGY